MAEDIRKRLSDDELSYVAGGATGRNKGHSRATSDFNDQIERTETRVCKICGETATHTVHMGGMVTCQHCNNSYSIIS